jgi:arabinose-5-phosphate isomerase
VLPAAKEACALNLAPTTSTTMTLALGDALAVALMEHRRSRRRISAGFHPGGRLGARLATVADLMHRGAEMPLIAAGAPMGEALIEMSRKGFGTVGVLEGGASRG